MIDIERKIIFTHPQKTGGTTIESAFGWHPKDKPLNYRDSYRNFFLQIKHSSLSYHIYLLNKSEHDYRDFFKFACVRNPWDAAVSFYFFFKKNGMRIALGSFEDFLLEVCKERDSFLDAKFFYFHNGKYEIDYVIRYENYKEDTEKVLKKYGVDWHENFNTGTRPENLPYQDLYNEKTKKMVENKAKDLINLFGYKF
jgi:hypothetical protein